MKIESDPSIGRFSSPAARERFLITYDRAFAALWPGERSEQDVETRFGVTHVHRSGAGTGEPVVLLHGANSNAVQWYPFIPALGAQHPVVAIDTIGDPGRSVARVAIHEPADSAAWLDEVLDGLRIERVHLVGHSYGGWLALNQAVRSSQRLLSITALDPGGLQKVGWRFFAYLYLNGLAGLLPGPLRRRAAERLDNPVLVVPELLKVLLMAARTYRSRRPAPLPLGDDEIRSIPVPLLLLLGQQSPLVHAQPVAERVRALLPASDVRVLPGVGHGPGFEHSSLVDAALVDFINSHPTPDTGAAAT
jgi:pimeloyl-ACP methyl ester carboxylesterase